MKLKIAIRGLLKNPFVMIVAIVSLALGIGANAANWCRSFLWNRVCYQHSEDS